MSRGGTKQMQTTMNGQVSDQKLLGLFELDTEGKVLYSSWQTEEGSMVRQFGFDGSDFFKAIARFSNVADLHHRFETFRLADSRSSSFEFTCEYPEGPHSVRVVMARLMTDTGPDSFLVHFKKP